MLNSCFIVGLANGNAYKETKGVMPLIQPEARLQLLFCFSNGLTTNRKDYNSIIMTFFKSTCYEDYLRI